MAGLYLVGAWLIVQVAATLLPVFEAPAWVMKTLVGLLVIGFIPALVISWVFELKPDGLRREDEISEPDSIAPETAQRMNRMIIVVLALALSYFAFDKFVLVPSRVAVNNPPAKAAAPVSAPPSNAANAIDTKSIAVLAFANMSADKDNEYFSDGVAEDPRSGPRPYFPTSCARPASRRTGTNSARRSTAARMRVATIAANKQPELA